MELQTDLESPQSQDYINIPTPMELQSDLDLESPQGQDDIKIPTLTWSLHKVEGDIKIHTPMELQNDLESP